MKPSDIQIGKTYINRGAGRTHRKVLAIGDEHRPKEWSGDLSAPKQPGVLYEQQDSWDRNYRSKIYLRSFVLWAGGELQ